MSAEELRTQLQALQEENTRLAQQMAQQSRENRAGDAPADNPLAGGVRHTPSVNRVAVKLPPFWADRPKLWFAQADSQFTISGIINEATKFHYVVAQLDTRYAAEVEDIIDDPPAENRYQFLRTKLIERLSASEEQRVRQLVSEEELGDRKPSQFLRHLRSLAGTSALQDNLLRQLWLRRLPSNVQAILTAQADFALDKLAELADKIVEVAPPPPPFAVNAASAANAAPSDANQNDATVLNAILALTRQVAELATTGNQRARPRSRVRTPSRGQSAARSDATRWCWYHSKFREQAKRCTPPCGYSENPKGSQ